MGSHGPGTAAVRGGGGLDGPGRPGGGPGVPAGGPADGPGGGRAGRGQLLLPERGLPRHLSGAEGQERSGHRRGEVHRLL